MSDKQQILNLLHGNRIPEARKLCATLCARNGTDAEAWFLLAGICAQLGELDEVVRCCRQVVAIEPGNVGAWYNLGVALQSRGKSGEAAGSYRRLLEIQPRHAMALANLALALRELGQRDEAMECCARAIALQPDLAEAHNTRGLLFRDRGASDNAIQCFQRAFTLRPGYAEACFNMGLCYLSGNDSGRAETCFRDAIRINPGYAEAHRGLGGVLAASQRPDEAVLSFRRAIELRPQWAEVHAELAGILISQRKWDEGISHYRHAVRIKPEFGEAHNNLGNALLDRDQGPRYGEEAVDCFRQALRWIPEAPQIHLNLAAALCDLGRDREAQASYRRVLELKPRDPLATAALANLLERVGDFDSAMGLVQPLIDTGHDEVQLVLSHAALLRHQNRREEAIALLEHALERPMEDKHRVDAHFALGRLHDETGNYHQAFHHYHEGNALDAKEFDEPADRRGFDALIAAFSPERINRRPRASNRSRLPVFIVGMPRSGTSLVEQILASHPLVHGAGELTAIFDISSELPSVLGTTLSYPQCLDQCTCQGLDRVAMRHLDYLSRLGGGAARVTDKMPHNFMALGLIDLLFPGARVIHCMRDPVDNCLSIYFQRFNDFHGYARDLGSLGRHYGQYRRLMAHWKSVLRIPVMDLQYESLVEDQEAVSRSMVEFCGLEWDERCLHFYESRRFVTTASYDQVRRPIYRKSVARWKRYERHLEPLLRALQD